MNNFAAVREDNDMSDTSFSEASVSTYPGLAVELAPRAVKPEPAWLSRGQIPSLNGLRAASILMVLLAHLSLQGTLVPRLWYLFHKKIFDAVARRRCGNGPGAHPAACVDRHADGPRPPRNPALLIPTLGRELRAAT